MNNAGVALVPVVGMGCGMPGSTDSPALLWKARRGRENVITWVPSERSETDEQYDAKALVPGRSVSEWGTFLGVIAGADPAFGGITEIETF